MQSVLLLLLFLGSSFVGPRAGEVEELVAKIKAEKDAAGDETVQKLGTLGTRAAMEGLLVAYDAMDTLYMRREVLRALAKYDGVTDCEQAALQKIADAATTEDARELRDAALKLLGDAEHFGKHFLAAIVDSPAEDSVRATAMELYAQRYVDDDYKFFQKLFRQADEDAPKLKPKKQREKEPQLAIFVLPRIREIALEKIAGRMDADELVDTARKMEKDATDLPRDGVRRLALIELAKRGDKRAIDLARDAYKSTTERSQNRVLAAELMAKDDGDKLANQFLDDGGKGTDVMPVDLRDKLADLVAEWAADPKQKALVPKLEKLLGAKNKDGQKCFALRALVKVADEKITKLIAKSLLDANAQVQIAAADVLAKRGDKTAVADLEKALTTTKKPEVQGALMDAIGALRFGEGDWLARLEKDSESKDTEVRNAALWQLAKLAQKKYLPLFVRCLESADWSTRLAALKGLEIIGNTDAISAIITRMEKEEGRMAREFCDALFRLTGQMLPPDPAVWKKWWEEKRSGFKGLGTGDLFKLQQEEETRRLTQASKNTFYGVRIVSHRAIFIIDVSGSMNEPTRSPYLGKPGEARMEVAKRELIKCIDALDKDALFNIVVFSSGVDRWLDEGVAESKDKERTDAKTFVSRLGADGGTNLYGAVQTAFTDPDVDTIYIMSDGEPSVGDVTDQAEIRARVGQWNEHRKIVIHTIAVGGNFQILEWLAADSGGTHVKYD
ncbi:MAG: HEAT repeat domain-containing protein [Planctomycetes bacterium]|nr:HEAT repeat domain-containing protein [Planctomycetota bacterium]